VREHARETCLSVCVHLSVYARAPHLLNDKLALSAFARRRRTCGIIVAVGAEHACVRVQKPVQQGVRPGQEGQHGQRDSRHLRAQQTCMPAMMILGAAMLMGTPPRRRSVSLRPSCVVCNLLAGRVHGRVRVSACHHACVCARAPWYVSGSGWDSAQGAECGRDPRCRAPSATPSRRTAGKRGKMQRTARVQYPQGGGRVVPRQKRRRSAAPAARPGSTRACWLCRGTASSAPTNSRGLGLSGGRQQGRQRTWRGLDQRRESAETRQR